MKILAVDDSFDWLNTHTLIFQSVFGEDSQIIGACSAFEGLEIFKKDYLEEPFDIVVTDLQMENDFEPMYAGEWLIKEIQNLRPKQKIMIVSSVYNIEQIADNYGVDFISKRNIVADPENYKIKIELTYK